MVVRPITFSCISAHSKHLFSELQILDIFKLHKLQLCTFMYDLLTNRLPHRFTDYCTPPVHEYSTRFKDRGNLLLPKVITSIGKFAITYTGTAFWKSLPPGIRS